MLKPGHPALAALLTALVALGPLSTDLYLPSLPALTAHFAADAAAGQATLSAFLLGLAGGQLIYGPLSDRFGRRPVLLFGLALYAVASVACVFAPSMPWLIAARFLQAAGACVGPVLGRAVVRDVYGREGAARMFSYMSAAMALAPMIGPVLGGVIESAAGWRANFAALSAYGVGALTLTLLLLPETHREREGVALSPARVAAVYGGFFRERAYFGYTLAYAFGYCGIFAFISGSSFVLLEAAGLTPTQYGFCFAVAVAGYVAGTLLSGRMSARLGIDRLIAAGGAIGLVGGALLLALALADSGRTGLDGAAAVVGPMVLFMVGIGLVMPNATAGAIGPFPRAAGSASALVGFLQTTLAAIAGALVGLFHDGTAIPMALAIVLATAAILAAFFGLVRPFGSKPPAA
jgi:DHA1 family bicyclomycin/chloramphenicol resistance-like MFS transporter